MDNKETRTAGEQAFDNIMDKYKAGRFKGDRDEDFINLVFRTSPGEVVEALDSLTDIQYLGTWKPTLTEYVIDALISYRVYGPGEAELQSIIDKAVLYYSQHRLPYADEIPNSTNIERLK